MGLGKILFFYINASFTKLYDYINYHNNFVVLIPVH
jgi:hypothetical protein